ncbi:hypothetical protein AAG570_000749 [Ranatra chinensis]|uniref:Uncharacterized protein n=1 Tax=Ranatra chinensis TaxID=642074 RepID=A0ABD0YXY7_9HEMI
MEASLALLLTAFVSALGQPWPLGETNSIEGEINDIMEMVPFDRVLAVAVDYAVYDQQVRRFVHYATGESFKKNVASFEASPQFRMAAGFAERYNVNLYSLANRINHILDIPQIRLSRKFPGVVAQFLKNTFPT